MDKDFIKFVEEGFTLCKESILGLTNVTRNIILRDQEFKAETKDKFDTCLTITQSLNDALKLISQEIKNIKNNLDEIEQKFNKLDKCVEKRFY